MIDARKICKALSWICDNIEHEEDAYNLAINLLGLTVDESCVVQKLLQVLRSSAPGFKN